MNKRILSLLVGCLGVVSVWAQPRAGRTTATAAPAPQPSVAAALPKDAWRNIGPFRGGRSLAVASHASMPYTYYFGATGGGVWKTTNGGSDWTNISDGSLGSSSVGAIAIAESEPNTLWIGTGERDIRGDISPGDGVYRSLDGGKTWQHMGLKNAGMVARIAIHPTNPNVVYVASMGQLFGANAKGGERGLYRTTDGGSTWKRILTAGDTTGAVHVVIDPSNPRVIYASLWNAWRSPWSMSSGGTGSALYKSTDGGDTWTNLSAKPGMPKGLLGKIGVSVSPLNPNRVWAIVENDNGGVFRSDDGGDTWTRTNSERNLRQRAWYYSHIIADPQNVDAVYVLNVNFMKSTDGGRTFSSIPVGHGDTHDLWIDPTNNQRMILGDDGGAEVTYNGGQSWSELDLPTGQFYHVTLDNAFPYNVYGAQQDNSSIGIASRTFGWGIGNKDWFEVAGGESGYIAVDPRNNQIVYGGNYSGFIERLDRRTSQSRTIDVWPENPMGSGAGANKYRWQWTFPIIFSPHDAGTLYVCSQYVHRTTNEGQSWETISPDLTRADSTKLGASGGPITKDNTGVEYYATVFALAESPIQKGLLWAGSDDGLIHVSRDGGKNWTNITPRSLPEWALISIIEPSPFDPGTAYVAATRYKSGDFAPYLLKTTDYGATWTMINTGIPTGAFTRVVRCDPNRKGLLYAGTETGMYVSFNDGASWQSLQQNLPLTPIHDIAIHKEEKDLVVATHGRAFWVLDDLTPLHQLSDDIAKKAVHLYTPRRTWRVGGASFPSSSVGQNPANGVVLNYWLAEDVKDTLKIEFFDSRDSLVVSFNSKQTPQGRPVTPSREFYERPDQTRQGVPTATKGLNRFVWNLRYPSAEEVPGAIYWIGSTAGPRVVPGTYKVRLTAGKTVQEQRFDVKVDPRLAVSQADLQAQFDLLMRIYKKVNETNKGINRLREVRKQLTAAIERIPAGAARDTVSKAAKPLQDGLGRVEDALIQTKIQAGQDALNYPIRLNNKLISMLGVVGSADARPTDQSVALFEDLARRIDVQLNALRDLLDKEVPALNALIQAQNAPAIAPK